MRFRYTFDVKGRIKPQQIVSFDVDGFLFEFYVEREFIRNIRVSFKIADHELPCVINNPEPGIALHINVTSPRIHEVEEIMRQIEGMLSFWGVEAIGIRRPKHEWIAENEEEKKKLKLYNFSVRLEELKDHEIRSVSFDLIARSIIASVKTKQHNVLLSFNKRGRVDNKNENYIEAIYNFYFVIESYYAGGKNKNHAVEKALKNSVEFNENINRVLADQEFKTHLPSELRMKYESQYLKKEVDVIIKELVMMRGFLHHYSTKRKSNWHPDKQHEFRLEAYFLEQLSHNVAFGIMMDQAYDTDVIKQYKELIKKGKNGNGTNNSF